MNRDNEPIVIDEVLNEITNLLIPECRIQNWTILIDGLTKLMLLTSEMKLQEKIAHLLTNINGEHNRLIDLYKMRIAINFIVSYIATKKKFFFLSKVLALDFI